MLTQTSKIHISFLNVFLLVDFGPQHVFGILEFIRQAKATRKISSWQEVVKIEQLFQLPLKTNCRKRKKAKPY